jgi:hypothetical protein
MIVFPIVDESSKVNRIHLMLGQESEEQFMMFGHYGIPLDDIKKQVFKNNFPTHLIITKVISETAAGMMVQRAMIQNHMQQEMFEQYGKGKSKGDLTQGVWVPDLICPKCSNKGVFLKKGEMALCKDCLKIEKGISPPVIITPKKKNIKEERKDEDKNTPGDTRTS